MASPARGGPVAVWWLTGQFDGRLLDVFFRQQHVVRPRGRLGNTNCTEVAAASAPAHYGSAQRGQELSLDIDANWPGQARHTEIETELVEVLVQHKSDWHMMR